MSAPRNFRLGWLVLCLSVTVSAYAGSNAQQTAPGAEQDGLVSNANMMNHNSSSITSPISSPLLAGQPGLPGNKFGGLGFSGGADQKQMGPPLPPIPAPIPEPNVLLDLGVGVTAFATMWSFRVRRSG